MLLNKLLSRVVLTGCLFFVMACGDNTDKTRSLPATPTYTLLFLDKSLSVNTNKNFVNQKYEQIVRELVEQNLRNKGDKLDVYFIHENTSKSKALSLTVRSERENIESANATDKEAIETAFQLSLQREKSIFLRQTLTKLHQQNNGASNQTTDIWASLPVIAKASESGSEVHVYYFSDMVESVKGPGRRDFHSHPPANDTEAENWAKEDVKKLEQHGIGSPMITFVSPFEPTASSKENSPFVTHYWQTLFQDLAGITVEEL